MIQVSHLSKQYDHRIVIDDVSFEASEHGIVGLLGKNGAGKSTIMNMVTGYLSLSAGSVKICGVDMTTCPEEAKAHLGYLPEFPPLYPQFTVEEYLRYACAVKRVRSRLIKAHVAEICERTGIGHVRGRPIGNLSKGYRQRVGLANALVGDPNVLILDEPSVGLDPQQMLEMREMITALGTEHLVILSTHILSEAKQVCDRVLIIDKGRIVAESGLNELLNGGESLTYALTVLENVEQARAALAQIDGLTVSPGEGNLLLLHLPRDGRDALLARAFYTLAEQRCPILALTSKTETLEEAFIRLTSGKEDT